MKKSEAYPLRYVELFSAKPDKVAGQKTPQGVPLLMQSSITMGSTEGMSISANEIESRLRQYGGNSNSFLILYDGYRYFQSDKGVLGYIENRWAWVGAAEPIAAEADRLEVFQKFSRQAHTARKCAISLPVSLSLAKEAVRQGYGVICVGTEPIFDLKNYDPTVDRIFTAKQLLSRGARVLEFTFESMGREAKEKLDEVVLEWLDSRKTTQLGFLNRVEPWTLSQHKRYFYLEYQKKILAFLAAIPIWQSNGWYFIDMPKKKGTPVGTTELLTLEAMRILKEEGVCQVSLGVSPLSKLTEDTLGSHPLLHRVLRYVYEHSNFLYGFKSLHSYKAKFQPTHWEPAYLVTSQRRMNLQATLGLVVAFMPKGAIRAFITGLAKSAKRIDFTQWIRKRVKSTLVIRSTPRTWERWAARCRMSLSLGIVFLVIYGLTRWREETSDSFLKEWSYSWNSFLQQPFQALALTPFLHWSFPHLAVNLFFLSGLTWWLEYLAGSRFMGICFFLSAYLSNPLTSGLGFALQPAFSPTLWSKLIFEQDIGASLGLFGCVGALSLFLKKEYLWVATLILLVIGYAWMSQSFLSLNHAVALLTGRILGWVLLRKRTLSSGSL